MGTYPLSFCGKSVWQCLQIKTLTENFSKDSMSKFINTVNGRNKSQVQEHSLYLILYGMKYYLTIKLKMAAIVIAKRIFKIKIWVARQTILLEHGNYYNTFCLFSLPTEQKFYHSVKTSWMILMTQLWSRRQAPKLTDWKLHLPCFMALNMLLPRPGMSHRVTYWPHCYFYP